MSPWQESKQKHAQSLFVKRPSDWPTWPIEQRSMWQRNWGYMSVKSTTGGHFMLIGGQLKLNVVFTGFRAGLSRWCIRIVGYTALQDLESRFNDSIIIRCIRIVVIHGYFSVMWLISHHRKPINRLTQAE